MEFSSSEQQQSRESHTCVVYDPRDGRIVHGHTFVGDGTGLFGPEGLKERERQTLEGARRNHGALARFRVLHVAADFRFEPNVAYRVDVKAGRLVEDPGWPLDRAHPEKTPAQKKPKPAAKKKRG